MRPSLTNCHTLTTTTHTYVASFAPSYTWLLVGCDFLVEITFEILQFAADSGSGIEAVSLLASISPNFTQQLTVVTLTDRQSLPLSHGRRN